MTVTNDTVHALRIGDLLIDSETGEILSETDYSIDDLALFLKDGQEQEKSWGAYNGAIKSAIGRKLDQAGVLKALTPYGTATWRTQVRKSAKADEIPPMVEELGLTTHDLMLLYQCATALDPKQLEAVQEGLGDDPNGRAVVTAIYRLIHEKTIHYVQLMPLRRAAPVVERVELQADEGD